MSLVDSDLICWNQPRPPSVAALTEPHHVLASCTRCPVCSCKSCRLIDSWSSDCLGSHNSIEKSQVFPDTTFPLLNMCIEQSRHAILHQCYSCYGNRTGSSQLLSNFTTRISRRMNNDTVCQKSLIIELFWWSYSGTLGFFFLRHGVCGSCHFSP